MLLFVRDEVREREPVVRGDELDGCVDGASRFLVEVAAAGEAGRELTDLSGVPAPEPTDRIAEPVVPLGKGSREASAVGAVGPEVPGLGDELRALEARIFGDRAHERRDFAGSARIARERGREIETETVDVHRLMPVGQAVEDQPCDFRCVGAECVAAARPVHVAPVFAFAVPVVAFDRVDAVVRLGLEAAHREGRRPGRAFAGVIEHHVE